MALARLGGARRPENYTWPGFVDALATLLMVIIFVLLVFVLIQVNLAYRVAGQDATMNDMRSQIVSLGDLLNLERKANDELKDELASISSLLDATTKGARQPRHPACECHGDAQLCATARSSS